MKTELGITPDYVLVTTNTPERTGLLMVRNTVLECLDIMGIPYLIVHGGMSTALLEFYISQAAGLVLPGGPDFAADRYQAQPHLANDKPDIHRDELELKLLAIAAIKQWPVLAFCRGLQAMWIHAGGQLIQHLPEITIQKHGRSGATYSDLYLDEAQQTIVLQRGQPVIEQLLAGYLPQGFPDNEPISITIRSMHHQAALEGDALELPLLVVGRAEDGTVEIVIDPRMPFWVAFQGHLEAEIAGRKTKTQQFLLAVLQVFKRQLLE